jgi:hypothetical protein
VCDALLFIFASSKFRKPGVQGMAFFAAALIMDHALYSSGDQGGSLWPPLVL